MIQLKYCSAQLICHHCARLRKITAIGGDRAHTWREIA
jgi:hypothetical protein